MTGLVYKSTGSWYTVKSDEGNFIECRIKGKFRIKGIKSTNPIAVGDVVDYEIDETSDVITGTIYNIHERKNYIVRKSVNLSHQMHIIASNIDRVFLLITVNNPPTTFNFIDRFLVTAEAYGIETVLVFNKIDTLDEVTLDEQLYMQHVYQQIGYTCLRVSSTEAKGIDKLKELMLDKVSMFSGHSGVGKSTLVNALEPALHLKTKTISEASKQGQHTTTFAEMYDLSFGARIIDTPGDN
jgi:ribosome biogenesis GTPase